MSLAEIARQIQELQAHQKAMIDDQERDNVERTKSLDWFKSGRLGINFFGPYGYFLYRVEPTSWPDYVRSAKLSKSNIVIKGTDGNIYQNVYLTAHNYLGTPEYSLESHNLKLLLEVIKEHNIKVEIPSYYQDIADFINGVNNA